MRAGMFADYQLVMTTDFHRVETLIGIRILEQTIDMDTRLVREHTLAHQTLLPGHRSSRSSRNQRRQGRKMREVDAGIQVVEFFQAHRDFFQRCITGAFAQTIHRGVDVRCTRHGGGKTVGRGEAEVVVRMHLDFDIHRTPQGRNGFVHAERFHHAQRIGIANTARTRGLCGFGHLQHEFRIGARSVFATDDDFQPVVVSVRHQFKDGIEHPGTVAFQLLGKMDVRHRY